MEVGQGSGGMLAVAKPVKKRADARRTRAPHILSPTRSEGARLTPVRPRPSGHSHVPPPSPVAFRTEWSQPKTQPQRSGRAVSHVGRLRPLSGKLFVRCNSASDRGINHCDETGRDDEPPNQTQLRTTSRAITPDVCGTAPWPSDWATSWCPRESPPAVRRRPPSGRHT
jgi:hypothetical protein